MLLFLDDGGEALSPLLQTLGRLHPMLVHLPVGLLMVLGAVEAWAMLRGRQRERKGYAAFVWFAALGAALAMGAGLLLHEEGGYGKIVETHEVLGIAVAGLSLTAAVCFTLRWSSAYRAFLFAAVLVLIPTGHFGAEMTHGKGFLTEPARRAMRSDKQEAERPAMNGASIAGGAIADPADAAEPAEPVVQLVSYESHVVPILAASCYDCHGEAKAKGGLAMDTQIDLLEGGFDGAPFVAGDPAASLMVQRTSLPLDHEDHMPPEGKPQPSAADLALLEAWIAAGASFTEPFDPPAEPEPQPQADDAPESAINYEPGDDDAVATAADPSAAALLALAGPAGGSTPAPPGTRSLPAALPQPAPAPPAALDALRADRWALGPLEPGATLLSLDAQAAADRSDGALAVALAGIAEQLGELNLARTEAGSETLAALAAAPHLESLDLTAAPVDSAAVSALGAHPGLRRLVLTETQVDDAALEALGALPALERLYLVGTAMTDEGLARLASERPELKLYPRALDAGGPPLTEVLEEEPEPVLARVETPAEADAEANEAEPGTAIVATNTTCPVSGAPVSGEHAVLIGGVAVATCCEKCALAVLQSPGEYGLE